MRIETMKLAIAARTPDRIIAVGERTVRQGTELLARYSIDALRISLGLVFLGFGALKFFPGLSPAEDLAVPTIEALTLGLVSGGAALLMTAVVETFIGITLITGKLVKTGLAVLGMALVGIMSPLVLFPAELFPGGVPTLEAQYVFKDIVLAAAGLVVAARALGARLIPDTAPTRETHDPDRDTRTPVELVA